MPFELQRPLDVQNLEKYKVTSRQVQLQRGWHPQNSEENVFRGIKVIQGHRILHQSNEQVYATSY